MLLRESDVGGARRRASLFDQEREAWYTVPKANEWVAVAGRKGKATVGKKPLNESGQLVADIQDVDVAFKSNEI